MLHSHRSLLVRVVAAVFLAGSAVVMASPAADAALPDDAPVSAAIVGGTPADGARWASVVRIETASGGLCTGRLLNATWALTAAHCIEPTATVRGGGNGSLAQLSWAVAATGIAHPYYDEDRLSYDYGLYQLSSAAPVPSGYAFEPLAEFANPSTWAAGASTTTFGWGLVSGAGPLAGELRQVTMPVVDDSVCSDLASSIGVSYHVPTQFCTYGPGLSSCNGDSGGPVFATDTATGVLMQVGVVSYGPEDCDFESFNAWVPQAVTWIRSMISGGPPAHRLWGADRYSTATALSASFQSAPVVFLATGENFPDSLAAGPVATRLGGPLLLVAKDSVPASTLAELARLRPPRVVLAGGEAAISAAVQNQLTSLGYAVERIAGTDRYDTAMRLNALASGLNGRNLWVASGRAFADPLVAAAAAAVYAEPFVLIEGVGALRADVKAHLQAYAPTSITVVGDATMVDAAALADLGTVAPVTIVPGADIHARSVAVWSRINSPTGVAMATSEKFPDALAGVAFAGAAPPYPLVLTPSNCVPTATRDRLRSWNVPVYLLGGPAALGSGVELRTPC